MLFTLDVQYTGSIEHAQASPANLTEQPTCPVCLGIFIILNAEFGNSFNFYHIWNHIYGYLSGDLEKSHFYTCSE